MAKPNNTDCWLAAVYLYVQLGAAANSKILPIGVVAPEQQLLDAEM
jgi:hypothetical protein